MVDDIEHILVFVVYYGNFRIWNVQVYIVKFDRRTIQNKRDMLIVQRKFAKIELDKKKKIFFDEKKKNEKN